MYTRTMCAILINNKILIYTYHYNHFYLLINKIKPHIYNHITMSYGYKRLSTETGTHHISLSY